LRGRPHHWFRAALSALVAVCLCVSVESQSATADQVKAAYLVNFAKFVEWPEGTFVSADASLQFCTFGRSAVADELESGVAGKLISGHPIKVRRLDNADNARNCQLVFVAASTGRQQQRVLEVFRGQPTLVVGDGEAFASSGGTIGFVTEKGRVLFEINVKSADESHLRISSRLLALARVIGSPEERQHP